MGLARYRPPLVGDSGLPKPPGKRVAEVPGPAERHTGGREQASTPHAGAFTFPAQPFRPLDTIGLPA